MIFSKNVKNKADKSTTISNVLKRVTKLSGVGAAGMLTWFITNIGIYSAKLTRFDIACFIFD